MISAFGVDHGNFIGKSEDSKAGVAAAGGATAGTAAYLSGYAGKYRGIAQRKAHKKKLSQTEAGKKQLKAEGKTLSEHTKKYKGKPQAEFFRNYPRDLPSAKLQRFLGRTHGGKTGYALQGAAGVAGGIGGYAAYKHHVSKADADSIKNALRNNNPFRSNARIAAAKMKLSSPTPAPAPAPTPAPAPAPTPAPAPAPKQQQKKKKKKNKRVNSGLSGRAEAIRRANVKLETASPKEKIKLQQQIDAMTEKVKGGEARTPRVVKEPKVQVPNAKPKSYVPKLSLKALKSKSVMIPAATVAGLGGAGYAASKYGSPSRKS